MNFVRKRVIKKALTTNKIEQMHLLAMVCLPPYVYIGGDGRKGSEKCSVH